MKSHEFDELRDLILGVALTARQSAVPSQVLLEIRNDMKEMKNQHDESHRVLKESHIELGKKMDVIDAKVTKTNGRVTTLELWRTSMEGFAKGVKAGGKGVWTAFVVTAGILLYLFGEFVKRKLGL